MTLLRQGLLDGRAVALAGGVAPAVHAALDALGARVDDLPPGLDEDGAREWAAGTAPLDALVYDAPSAFAGGGSRGSRWRSSVRIARAARTSPSSPAS
jgi:hypothetical protein